MTKQDNNFLEEFKKLEQLCNQMYGPHSGVTHYINIMSEVSSEKAHKIDGWYDDLKMLKASASYKKYAHSRIMPVKYQLVRTT